MSMESKHRHDNMTFVLMTVKIDVLKDYSLKGEVFPSDIAFFRKLLRKLHTTVQFAFLYSQIHTPHAPRIHPLFSDTYDTRTH